MGNKEIISEKENAFKKSFSIEVKCSPSGSFFIDFSNDEHYIVSVKISDVVAKNIAKDLGLKIGV